MRYFLIIIIVFLVSNQFLTAKERITFEHLTKKDGLSNGTINKTFRDSRGFIWICTDDGLNRYDGYNFIIYQPVIQNITSNAQFKDICEDSLGRLWLATNFGLFFYTRESDKILSINVLLDKKSQQVLPDGLVNALYIDRGNNLWIATFEGAGKLCIRDSVIDHIDEQDLMIYKPNRDEAGSLTNDWVYGFAEDSQSHIWVTSNSNILDEYIPEVDSFIHHPIVFDGNSQLKNTIKRVIVDPDNTIWVYSEGEGVVCLDRGGEVFKPLNLRDNSGKLLNISLVRAIMFDREGRIWIGTDGNGIIVWDKTNDVIEHYRYDEDDLTKLSSNAIYSLYEDNTGTIWVGTYITGLNKLALNKSRFGLITGSPFARKGLNYGNVTHFCETYNGRIWIGTDGGGINVLNPDDYTFTYFKHDPENSQSISTNIVITLFEDRDKNIWIGTYSGGLNKFDPVRKTFKHFWNDPEDSTSLSSNHPWSVAQDDRKNLWVATVNRGLNLQKYGSELFIRYFQDEQDLETSNYISSNGINYLFVDSRQNLWICTEYGLDKVDLNKVDFKEPKPKLEFVHYNYFPDSNSISSNRVSYITEDKNGHMWIGTTGGGLNKLDYRTGNFTVFTVDSGLPHNTIMGILFDDEDNLWLSTSNGLSKMDMATEQFKNYGLADGLQSQEFLKTSCLKSKDGVMYFGGVKGFNAFYPGSIELNEHRPNVVFTDFKLFNKPIAIGEKIHDRVILPKAISELDKIELSYQDNFVTFEFTALDYYSPESNLFSYKMEGFDNEWRIIDATNRMATYTNLNPGVYIFRVKACNNDGLWNEEGSSIELKIYPPWWQTWWFILLSVLFVFGMLMAVYFYRVIALKRQQRILEGMVKDRTSQLQEANNELKELNATKDKFVSIIAHDILNPFNTILGFSELLIQNFNDWVDKEKLETIQLIFGSSKRLFELLENLLQWSRSERGMLTIQPAEFELSQNIKEIISLLLFSASAKNITIEESYVQKSVMVYADLNLIHTILRNLLSNAIKFTPSGGKIEIDIQTDEVFAYVSVRDNGVGIEDKNLENLFKIDVEHSTVGTNNEKGTGLGLVLVKDFVSKQGGELVVKSEVGKGSSFTFSVPLAK